MRVFTYITMPILIAACSGSNQEQETVDFDDYAGGTGAEDVDSTVNDIQDQTINISSMQAFIKLMKSEYDTVTKSVSHPIDRFNFSTSEKISFNGKFQVPYGKSIMVTPIANFFYYSFSDTNRTINAFYNYLDLMAENGESDPIRLNQDVKSMKSPPLFMMVYDTIIISAEYQCEHKKNDWDSFQDSLIKVYGSDYKYRIEMDCGGPLKWK
jgi:hypothetical protein